jgi:hypothetical protein
MRKWSIYLCYLHGNFQPSCKVTEAGKTAAVPRPPPKLYPSALHVPTKRGIWSGTSKRNKVKTMVVVPGTWIVGSAQDKVFRSFCRPRFSDLRGDSRYRNGGSILGGCHSYGPGRLKKKNFLKIFFSQ